MLGNAGQSNLRAASVCVIGLGGVGSWAVEALARSGVGALTLMDLDEVCISNTNRQLHSLSDTVGRSKAAVLAERVARINPECAVRVREEWLTVDGALDLVRELIDAGADVDASGRYDGVEGPPLWWAAIAARNGEGEIAVDLARVLIGARASVDVRGGYVPGVVRTSALVLAAQGVPGNGTCAELARVLFVAGARLDAADAAALALYRFGSAVSVVKSEIGAR